jgi:hypothetical protein
LWELPEAVGLLDLPAATLMARRSRGISSERIQEPIYTAPVTAELAARISRDPALAWTTASDRARLTLVGPHKRWIAELEDREKEEGSVGK